MDAVGLRTLATNSSTVRALDDKIAAPLGATLRDDQYFCEALARSMAQLPGLPSLDALDAAIAAEGARVEALARAVLRDAKPATLARGIAIQYFVELWAATHLDPFMLVAWLGRPDHARRLLEEIAHLATTMATPPRRPLEIEAEVGLLPEPYRSQLPRLKEGGPFFTRYDELAKHLASFRANFSSGATLLLVERNLDVPYERILPIGETERERIVLVCRGPGAGRLAAWRQENRCELGPTSIHL